MSEALNVPARTVTQHEVLTLRGHDREVFLDALLRPARPNKTLRQAANRYKIITGSKCESDEVHRNDD